MTPISSPRFSKQKTCSTSSNADSSSVRSAQTSTTARARSTGRRANDESCCDVKQTTSQRPTDGRRSIQSSAGSSGAGSGAASANDGKRFSKTTTS